MAEEQIQTALATTTLSDWATLITAAATLLTVIVAWIGIFKTIKNDRDVAKKSQTLGIILDGERSEIHEQAFAVLKAHPCDGRQSIARLAVDKNQLDEGDREDADSVYELLNWYEYLAVGVRHNILSEEILRNSSFSTMNYIWGASRLFVQGVRTRVSSDTFCEAFEWLMGRWEQCGYNGELPAIKFKYERSKK